MGKMTREQQIMAEKNINLLYRFLIDKKIDKDKEDEYYETYCNAVMGYDKSKGYTFSSYLYDCLDHKKINIHVTNTRLKRDPGAPLIYLDDCVKDKNGEDGEDYYNSPLMAELGYENGFSTIEIVDAYERFKEQLAPSYVAILKQLERGKTQSEIAREKGFTRQAISKKCVYMKEGFKFYLEHGYVYISDTKKGNPLCTNQKDRKPKKKYC